MTAGTALTPGALRAVLRRHASGVVVITAPGADGGPPAGFTATSFTSVSLDPPLVSFCLNRTASSWPAVTAASHVAVHVLTDAHEELARTFATSGIDRFARPTRWRTGPHGVPVLDGVPAVLVCRIAKTVGARGDHTIVLAEPLTAEHDGEQSGPLLYHMGRYLRAA